MRYSERILKDVERINSMNDSANKYSRIDGMQEIAETLSSNSQLKLRNLAQYIANVRERRKSLKLENFLGKYLTTGGDTANVKSEDGGPGSGRYPKGSGGNGEKVSATGANKFSKGFSKRNLNEHFGGKSDHSQEYPGMTKQDYAKRALELVQKPVGGNIRGYKLPNGQIARYDKNSNDYVKGRPNGGIATMFKPKDGEAYYLRKLEKEGGTEYD